MNVGLWAEIRRLSEIEKLSGWAIARRLHCSRHTVAAALELDQPPPRQGGRRTSLLDPYKPRIDALVAQCPDLSAVRIREEIARGPDGYQGSTIILRRNGCYRWLASRLTGFEKAAPKQLDRRFIETAGTVTIEEDRLAITLDRRCHNPILREAALDRDPMPIPWIGGRKLVFTYR
jgi:hypothetical protein